MHRCWTRRSALRGHEPIVALAEQLAAPVYTAWRRLDAFPNGHGLYRGTLPTLPDELLGSLHDADLLLAIGTRLDEFTTLAYTVPGPHQQVVPVVPVRTAKSRPTHAGLEPTDLPCVASRSWVSSARQRWADPSAKTPFDSISI